MADANTTGTATSRARTVRPALRKPTKARLAISGASGSGKTWTALSIARVLSPRGRVVLVDSEPSDEQNTAAELYADHFEFDLLDWRTPPFDPRDLALTLADLGRAPDRPDVVIVDSGSPFWRGTGGTLDIADGRFGGWKTATPAQDDLVRAILTAPFHVIFCMRAKMAYEVEEGGDKKQQVRKLGLAPIQRDDLEYEFQVVVMMDGDHRIDISKTRCADLAGQSFHANQQDRFATVLKAWLDRGVTVLRMSDADLLVAAFEYLAPEDARKAAKRDFAAEFARPDRMEVDDLPDAWRWLSDRLDVPGHPYVDAGAGRYECSSCGLPPAAGWHDDDADYWTPGTAPGPPEASETAPDGPETPPTGEAGTDDPETGGDDEDDGGGAGDREPSNAGPAAPAVAAAAETDDDFEQRPFDDADGGREPVGATRGRGRNAASAR